MRDAAKTTKLTLHGHVLAKEKGQGIRSDDSQGWRRKERFIKRDQEDFCQRRGKKIIFK